MAYFGFYGIFHEFIFTVLVLLCLVVCIGDTIYGSAQRLLLALLALLKVSQGLLVIKPGLATFKTSTLSIVLSFSLNAYSFLTKDILFPVVFRVKK